MFLSDTDTSIIIRNLNNETNKKIDNLLTGKWVMDGNKIDTFTLLNERFSFSKSNTKWTYYDYLCIEEDESMWIVYDVNTYMIIPLQSGSFDVFVRTCPKSQYITGILITCR
jgi:hypothetical protein